jgi:hypothetical protein
MRESSMLETVVPRETGLDEPSISVAASNAGTAGSNAGNSSDPRTELTRLLMSNFRTGADLKPADREYVSNVVAAKTGLSQADADKRVNDVLQHLS